MGSKKAALVNYMPGALQVNYLTYKACNTGKDYNTIISMLHHFLAVYGFGEKRFTFTVITIMVKIRIGSLCIISYTGFLLGYMMTSWYHFTS